MLVNRSNLPVRVIRPGDPRPGDRVTGKTILELWGMAWQITQDAWAFRGEPIGESRLRRDVVRVVRGGR